MKRANMFLYSLLLGFCLLFYGVGYAAQSELLTSVYARTTAVWLTAVLLPGLQALGVGLFSLGLRSSPAAFGRRQLSAALLIASSLCILLSQDWVDSALLLAFSCLFALFGGIVCAQAFAMLTARGGSGSGGTCFGLTAALAGCVGIALISAGGGRLLTGHAFVPVAMLLGAIAFAMAIGAEDIPAPAAPASPAGKKQRGALVPAIFCAAMVGAITVRAFTDWNIGTLFLFFLALGVMFSALFADRAHVFGGIVLIAAMVLAILAPWMPVLIGAVVFFAAVGVMRGWTVAAAARLGESEAALLPCTVLGLCFSRLAPAVVSALELAELPDAVFPYLRWAFAGLAALFLLVTLIRSAVKDEPVPSKEKEKPALSAEERLALFAAKYSLTARETDLLRGLSEGLNDTALAEKYYISASTVRFHVSNAVHKTGCANRADCIRHLLSFDPAAEAEG